MLNDRKYKQIVNEWFARLEKGYAELPYTKHELQVLGPILKRNNIHKSPFLLNLLEADGITQPPETVTSDEYKDLIKKIENAADKYARYLTVFHYFAPDSLGTISEILLSKLLGGTHTGGSQGLTDLRVGNTIGTITFESLRASLLQWGARGFPNAYVVHEVPIAAPSVCSDGVVRNLTDYIPFCSGKTIQGHIASLQARLPDIAVSFAYSGTAILIVVSRLE